MQDQFNPFPRMVVTYKGARLEILAQTDEQYYVVPVNHDMQPIRSPLYVSKGLLREAINQAGKAFGQDFIGPNYIQ